MNNSLRSLKAYLQHLRKSSKNLLHGYSFYYASKQSHLDISSYKYEWSSFTTPIKKRSGLPNVNENRLYNMQLAANKIDGLILQPQQIFGFWNRVPRPIIKNGFRSGPMLVRGKLTNDVGGGLCQISTTLFNALLWANFEVIERSNHSIDAHGEKRFFTLGQDATVAYGYKDLIVRNMNQISLLLRLQVFPEKAEVTASIWGTEEIPFDVKVESNVVQELTLPDGGMSGWEVETKRFVGNEEKMNYQAVDIYKPHVPAVAG
ncbi:putative vancomycin resistance protein [Rivularia sp. PCC 7116]|uniref:VanW family protein n=1 Tax=Rivularia sp. PCC 7116 TaxID=373994 RepID=UPI00029EF7FA|nr:VanW family protein [Rivularia sp. PCC 7116]AFY58990.1 putative vancomycin resistance protein [Rivularia sp. PCC 7116]